MWPRLVNRGRTAGVGLGIYEGSSVLQCGRGWLTAEGAGGPTRSRLCRESLQCGRGWLTAEGATFSTVNGGQY